MPPATPDDFVAETLAFLPSLLEAEARRRLDFSLADRQTILRRGGHIGSLLIHHPSLPRAMAEARRLIAADEECGQATASGFLVIADKLSESRGRFHRLWHAPPGGLWGCLALANTMLPASRALLPLALGVAATETVRVFASASLRWVNDVLLDGRKVAGFLIESFSTPRYREEFDLAGLAFNLNNQDFPTGLRDSAVSLAAQLGQEISLPYFLAVFLVKLRWNIGLLLHEEERLLAERLQTAEGVEGHRLLAAWRLLTNTLGRRLRHGFDVLTNPQYEAVAIDIDEGGGLILEHADGWRRTEYSGEIRYLD
ncbi:MAG: biotin--[acetyl-CoA-carboxylase] ligase [Desulfobulbaceae bacterium]|jgi:BirA family biotin operon repressor/biotin-[acetyl-CoA-carboxylase] ligase|nr:biotin--[acetyl-CoA-carboxylase] ligase [Desulfobulbaceae bacterium]